MVIKNSVGVSLPLGRTKAISLCLYATSITVIKNKLYKLISTAATSLLENYRAVQRCDGLITTPAVHHSPAANAVRAAIVSCSLGSDNFEQAKSKGVVIINKRVRCYFRRFSCDFRIQV